MTIAEQLQQSIGRVVALHRIAEERGARASARHLPTTARGYAIVAEDAKAALAILRAANDELREETV